MNLITQNTVTMTSREIAELVGSPHDSVLKTIRRLIDEGIVFGNETPYTHPQNGQTYSQFNLSFRDTMVVASGYSAEMRAKIIDRWQELEAQAAKPTPGTIAMPDFSNPVLAARAWADAKEAEQAALAQLQYAVHTKAEIGSRREATSMATASTAVRQAETLRKELGRAKSMATIRAVSKAVGEEFQFRPLSNWCKAHEIIPEYVTDPLYGEVRTYPAEAWQEVYGISLEKLF